MSDDGFIALNANGFWKQRHPPSRSLLEAATFFNKIGGRTIVEIGTGIHGQMSGNSMIIWANETTAKKIIAVDLNQQRLKEVEQALGDDERVELVLENGIDYLRESAQNIDLLYLDFWVEDEPGNLEGTARSEAYQLAYEVSREKMSEHSLILIDDTDHIDPWKHSLIVPAARRDGFITQYTGRQTLLLR